MNTFSPIEISQETDLLPKPIDEYIGRLQAPACTVESDKSTEADEPAEYASATTR
jgi:hypothetical protein